MSIHVEHRHLNGPIQSPETLPVKDSSLITPPEPIDDNLNCTVDLDCLDITKGVALDVNVNKTSPSETRLANLENDGVRIK